MKPLKELFRVLSLMDASIPGMVTHASSFIMIHGRLFFRLDGQSVALVLEA